MQRNDSAMDTRGAVSQSLHAGTVPFTEKLDLQVLAVSIGGAFTKLEFALLHYHQNAPNATLSVELQRYKEQPVENSTRTHTLNLLRDSHRQPTLNQRIDTFLGRLFSDGIQGFCETNNIDMKVVDFIAIHTPDLGRAPLRLSKTSVRNPIERNNIIRNKTGKTVVSDFSVSQSASGAMSSSPVAFVDWLLLKHPSKFRACVHIDETINIGFIPPLTEGRSPGAVSYDCGPGNLLIDYAMRYCTSNDQGEDHEGAFAAQGKVNDTIVDQFLALHDYQVMRPSLSIAHEMFGDHEAQRLVDECLHSKLSEADTVATVTRVTAKNIIIQYRRLLQAGLPADSIPADELFICGPGARNSSIIDYLELELPEHVITKPLEDIGIPNSANEAVCYAHLAFETVLGQVVPSIEDRASAETQKPPHFVNGNILPGAGWTEMLRQLQRFSQGRCLQGNTNIKVTIAGDRTDSASSTARRVHDRTGFPE